MVYFNVPDGVVGEGPVPAGWRACTRDARLRVTALFLFPALIWMLSAPLVDAIENQLSLFLLRRVTAVVFFTFNTLGYPVVQQGNVLVLPRGEVQVAEACSGILSLTACLFAGSFLAAVFLDRLWKKVVLIGLALLLAFLTNLLRSHVLTAWAYAYGSDAIEGTVHDVTGYAVLGLTCVGLLGLLPLFNPENWLRWFGKAEPAVPPKDDPA
jgi:exosortase